MFTRTAHGRIRTFPICLSTAYAIRQFSTKSFNGLEGKLRENKENFSRSFLKKFKSTKRCRKCEKYFNPKKRKTNFKKFLTYLKHFERNRCILSTWPSLTSVLLLSAKKYRVSRHYDLYIEQNMVIYS